MTEQVAPQHQQAGRAERIPNSLANGFVVFAGVLMVIGGAFQGLAGLIALFENNVYVNTPNYLIELDLTGWGWIHLMIGLVVLFAGLAVLSGQAWGRMVGMGLAGISAIANFLFIPYYPIWSLLIIALDVFIIWALATHGKELAD